jgi:L-ascorbate metabolism protein UlaG (beta-lactamase superfamily)
MKVKYFGHSCFEVISGNKAMLFDPFISGNPIAAGIDVDKINPDYMLISHGHEDHVGDAVRIAGQSGCLCIGIWEIHSWLQSQGISNTHPMNIGGSYPFDFGTVKMVNAVHSSSLPNGDYGGNPAGFVIHNSEDCFYYAGDTALHSDMQLISRKFKLKCAFLPIGNNFTMDIYDAIDAARMLGTTTVVGMHYDTFAPIKINHEEAHRAFQTADIHLHLMKIGESIEI